MKIMKVYKHKNHNVYSLTQKIQFMKMKTKTIFFYKGKTIGNIRFIIKPHKQWKYFRWFIRLPFFYFERTNVAIFVGTPNSYFWIHYRGGL